MEALKEIEVRELHSPPIIVPSNSTISKIVGTLKENDAYEVFLVDKDRIGMVTTRDILKVSHLASTKTSPIVRYPTKLSPTTKLGDAARILINYRLRALPIVEGKEVVGALTSNSILKFLLEKGSLNFPVKSLASAKLIKINETDTIAKARNIMVEKKIDHLPVTPKKKVTGIITSSQIVFRLIPRERVGSESFGLEGQRNLGHQVKAVMETRPLSCQARDEAYDVLRKMVQMKKTYALITVLDMVQGIVTTRDFAELVAEPRPKPEIPVYIIGLPEDPFEAEVAKSKFLNVVSVLRRSYPEIEEARSIVKISESVKGKERRRYEVDVAIKMPKEIITYTHRGWELPIVYDELVTRLKRLLSKKRRFVKRYKRRGIKK